MCLGEIFWKNFETSGVINLRRFMSCADCVLQWKIERCSWFCMSARQLSSNASLLSFKLWTRWLILTLGAPLWNDLPGETLNSTKYGSCTSFLWALAEEVHAIPQYIAINVPVHFARFSKRQEVRKTSREGNIKDIEDKKETWQPRSRKGFIPVRRRQSSSNFEPTTNYFFKLSKVTHWL